MLVTLTFVILTTLPSVIGDCTICSCEKIADDIKVTCKGHHIEQVPQQLPKNTTKLYLSGTGIVKVKAGDFSRYPELTELFFRDTEPDACNLEDLEPGVFNGLDSLIAIGMIGCRRLTSIKAGVFGTFQKLGTLHIYRSGLSSVPDFTRLQIQKSGYDGYMEEIDLHNNHIEDIGKGVFSGVKSYIVNLCNNKIQQIGTGDFSGIEVDTLKLGQNEITVIEKRAFRNATIKNLLINKNTRLTSISPEAFEGGAFNGTLDLSDSKITALPTIGLGHITHLILKNTPTLKHFPSVLQLSKIEKAELYYPHHCCAFNNPEKQDPAAWKFKQAQKNLNNTCTTTLPPSSNVRIKRNVLSPADHYIHPPEETGGVFGNISITDLFSNTTVIGTDDEVYGDPVSVIHNQVFDCGEVYVHPRRNITCTPEPDAFNPCEDVMGYVWLRVTIWFVLLAALLGNSLVLFVLITSRSKFGVPKFLMCNLAFADFIMGLYLIFIASIDIHTLGEYFNYAVQWQNGGGCQAAGFLSVFASELSVFTLTILTLERWYAISHAIHLNKRLKFRQSICLMAFGFVFAIALAVLPLVGVSGYGTVSICLPMKAKNSLDVSYVVSLLVMNGLMFLAICLCYLNMYWKVKGNANSARNNDATIAKRMAILVFTNFACWAPIAFFGLTASAGMPLIDITNSKILLVFFYPLNSCANPFLYAILTKQFRKDIFILLGKYGICVEKANQYRGTYTSRSMSQSRGHKDIVMHGIHKRTESLFSRLSNLPESTNGSRGSVSSTPKVHPCLQRSQRDTHFDQSQTEPQDEYVRRGESGTSEENKAASQGRDHPPYIRSVSDYTGLNSRKDNSNKCLMRTRKSTETTSTYISSGADSSMDILSDTLSPMNEDVWQIRENADSTTDKPLVDVEDESYKGRPFTCLIYPQDDEIRISHKNCYTVSDGMDLEDDENFQRFLRDDIINSVNLRRDSNNRSPTKPNSNPNFNNRYKFARSPSLSSLEENAETCLLHCETLRRASSGSCGNDIELQYVEGTLKTDKSKESGFHSSLSMHGENSI